MSEIQPIRVAYAESRTVNQKPGNWKFWAPLNERNLIGRNLERIKLKSKVSTVDIQIKRLIFSSLVIQKPLSSTNLLLLHI